MSKPGSTRRRHNSAPHNAKDICFPSGRKTRHASRKAAQTTLNQIRGKSVRGVRPPEKLPTAVYKCRHCSGWHLTSKEQRS